MNIKRVIILNAIADELGMSSQWLPSNRVGSLESATAHLHRAETLIELLEVHDCGSVGGFDKGQRYPNGDVFKRFNWLLRKHHGPSAIKGTWSYTFIKKQYRS